MKRVLRRIDDGEKIIGSVQIAVKDDVIVDMRDVVGPIHLAVADSGHRGFSVGDLSEELIHEVSGCKRGGLAVDANQGDAVARRCGFPSDPTHSTKSQLQAGDGFEVDFLAVDEWLANEAMASQLAEELIDPRRTKETENTGQAERLRIEETDHADWNDVVAQEQGTAQTRCPGKTLSADLNLEVTHIYAHVSVQQLHAIDRSHGCVGRRGNDIDCPYEITGRDRKRRSRRRVLKFRSDVDRYGSRVDVSGAAFLQVRATLERPSEVVGNGLPEVVAVCQSGAADRNGACVG